MIIRIKSGKNLLDVLNKNPNTDFGLYVKPHINGFLIGNAVSEDEYHIIFQDTKNSYTQYNDNQIDFKSFCHGRVVLSILSEFFKHLFDYPKSEKIGWLDKSYDDVDTDECAIVIENIWINSNYVKNESFFLSKYLDGIQIKEKGRCLYSLSLSAKNVREVINRLAIVCFLIQSADSESLFFHDELLIKYIKILNNIKETPYFLYYLFSKRLGGKFKDLVSSLEDGFQKNRGIPCKFTPNDTQGDRIQFVRNNIDFSNTILDYGCGEMQYARALQKKSNKDVPFYSYDKDDYSELWCKLKERYPQWNWVFTQTVDVIPRDLPISLLCSEVIEHNDLVIIMTELVVLINNWNIKQIVLTTPNRSFNKYYGLDGMRHEDHVQEFDIKELVKFIDNVKQRVAKKLHVEFFDIGDVVDTEPTTFGVVINIGGNDEK